MRGSFVIVNKAEVSKRRLRAMGRRIANPEPAWPRVGRMLSLAVRKQFLTRGAYLGTPWKPLKPDYLLWKVTNGYPWQTLVMRGDLRDSFIERPMSVETYLGKSAIFGSNDRKVVWHQFGTFRNGKRVNPARPMLVANQMIRDETVDILRKYIRGRGEGVY